MTTAADEAEAGKRIDELNSKATQMLLFLSFAIVGAATIDPNRIPVNPTLVRNAMQWWIRAMVPVLVCVLPVKDYKPLFRGPNRWYGWMQWMKVVLMTTAVALSATGAIQFLRAVYP